MFTNQIKLLAQRLTSLGIEAEADGDTVYAYTDSDRQIDIYLDGAGRYAIVGESITGSLPSVLHFIRFN